MICRIESMVVVILWLLRHGVLVGDASNVVRIRHVVVGLVKIGTKLIV